MNDIKMFTFEPGRKPAYHPSASGCELSRSPEQKADLISTGHQASKALKKLETHHEVSIRTAEGTDL